MRRRLRPAWSPEDLDRIYPAPHDHRLYGRGHRERVAATIQAALNYLTGPDDPYAVPVASVADLSCGNASIARAIPSEALYLGDFAPGYEYHGPLELTLVQLPDVEVYVCSETLEHLDDPDAVLALIATKALTLVLSTPVDAWGDTNDEHYWAWDREGVEEMLAASGWVVASYGEVDSRAYGEPYCYGIWVAERP